MGTKKYPKENDYYSYLSEHSGKLGGMKNRVGGEKANVIYIYLRSSQCLYWKWKHKLLLWSRSPISWRCIRPLFALFHWSFIFWKLYRKRIKSGGLWAQEKSSIRLLAYCSSGEAFIQSRSSMAFIWNRQSGNTDGQSQEIGSGYPKWTPQVSRYLLFCQYYEIDGHWKR